MLPEQFFNLIFDQCQMMAGNPNWWSMNNGMHPHDQHHHHHVSSSSSSSSSQFASFPPNSSNPNSISDHHQHQQQEFPIRSWSQLLLGGLTGGEDERYGANLFQQQKKLENWEDQVLNLNPPLIRVCGEDVKQESGVAGAVPHQSSFTHGHRDDEFQAVGSSNSWPPHMPLVSSPTSCITNNILNFSSSSAKSAPKNPDPSSECNSGVPSKKPRVQHSSSSAQPALKVRKEKLGERITALHQLVSPFGKTDTASVLSEAIGYIRFLQGQIEALSSPYMRNAASTGIATGQQHHHQHSFSNDVGMERGVPKKDGSSSDLRSRGLCLVPMSCTQHMPNDGGGADYWAPPGIGGGGF